MSNEIKYFIHFHPVGSLLSRALVWSLFLSVMTVIGIGSISFFGFGIIELIYF